MNDKKEKLLNKILNEIKNDEEISKLNYAQLADHIIQTWWDKEEWGSYNCSVLDRVIRILFELNDDFVVENNEEKLDKLKKIV